MPAGRNFCTAGRAHEACVPGAEAAGTAAAAARPEERPEHERQRSRFQASQRSPFPLGVRRRGGRLFRAGRRQTPCPVDAIGLAVDPQDDCPVEEPVQQRHHQRPVVQVLVPVLELDIRNHARWNALLPGRRLFARPLAAKSSPLTARRYGIRSTVAPARMRCTW